MYRGILFIRKVKVFPGIFRGLNRTGTHASASKKGQQKEQKQQTFQAHAHEHHNSSIYNGFSPFCQENMQIMQQFRFQKRYDIKGGWKGK
jgi:hypothetical protein